ncbi:MAG: hypothetical protein RJA98_2575 [Pseudomonadota bacterium]|jgi:hypothetical protein
MAKIAEVERRLLNWARWRASMGQGGGRFARVSMAERVDCSGFDDSMAVISIDDHEAEQTDQAVMGLQSHLRATVECVYLGNGTLAEKSRRLCIAPATIKMRVDQAHRLISIWFSDRAAAVRAEAERLAAALRGSSTH